MPIVSIPLVDGYSKQDPLLLDSSETWNMYQTSNAQPSYLRSMAGVSKNEVLDFAGKNSIRKMHIAYDGYLYVVAANTLYRVDTNFNISNIGDISNSFGYVGAASNDHEVVVVDGNNGSRFDWITSTFEDISADGFPHPAIDIDIIDNVFIVARGDTSEFFKSRYRDGSRWDALDFKQIESKTTKIQAIRTLHQSIYIFGDRAIEPWGVTANIDFPFARINGALIEFGSITPKAILGAHGVLTWLAFDDNGFQSIMMTAGNRASVISTPSVEREIQSYAKQDDAEGYAYDISGHAFFDYSFPTADTTWTYDLTINKWYKRSASDFGRFPVNSHVFFAGKHLVGVHDQGKIYEMSADISHYIDEPIRRRRISRLFRDDFGRIIKIKKLIVNILPGEGGVDYPDKDSYLELSISKDGGYTYERARRLHLPRLGNTGKRLVVDSLGVAGGGDDGIGWVFMFEFFGDMPFLLGDLYADIEILGSL